MDPSFINQSRHIILTIIQQFLSLSLSYTLKYFYWVTFFTLLMCVRCAQPQVHTSLSLFLFPTLTLFFLSLFFSLSLSYTYTNLVLLNFLLPKLFLYWYPSSSFFHINLLSLSYVIKCYYYQIHSLFFLRIKIFLLGGTFPL